MADIRIKRVWDPFEPTDGSRFLVDPRWPPGVDGDALRIVLWIREVAPSRRLEKWWKKNQADWTGFVERYRAELDQIGAWEPIARQARLGPVTLIYASRDREHNHARVLAEYLAGKAE